jgi:hypothetical protein
MISKIITRNDTAANWQSSTVPLALGQFGYDNTNNIVKIGDGSTLWGGLPVLGSCSDAGVTWGEFGGTNNQVVSINVGSSAAKKIYVCCMPSGTTSTATGTIMSLYYDAVGNESEIVYQGADAHYVGTYINKNFTIEHSTVTKPNGDTEHIYDIGFYSSGNPTYAKYASGARYIWFCVTKDIPANYESDDATNITGSFVGNGTPTQKIYIGANSVDKVYITCTPTDTSGADTGAIYSLFYDATTGDKYITYQGGSPGYIGHYGESNFTVSFNNYYMTIGFYSSVNPNYSTFINGVTYNWIVTTDSSYRAPSGPMEISKNGEYDVAAVARAIVNITASGGAGMPTQYKTDTYTPTSTEPLSSISINVGFKPKIFMLTHSGGVISDTTSTSRGILLTTQLVTDDAYNIVHRNSSYLFYSNGKYMGSRSENASHTFDLTNIGVTGGEGSFVYLLGGHTYNWYAWG